VSTLPAINSNVVDAGRKVRVLDIDLITVGLRHRAICEDSVAALADSMEAIGLRTPISISCSEDGAELRLVAGAHRLAAAQRLGWSTIECIVDFDTDEVDAELWEIDENLQRAELSALERDQHIARRIVLVALKVRQLDEPLPGGKQPTEKGQAKAARELGISEPDVRRAVKVASLSDEAKQVAREVGLDDNRSALLAAAKHEAASDQVAELRRKAEDKAFHVQARENLPQSVKDQEAAKQQAIESRKVSSEQPALYNGLTAEARLAELEEHVRVTEAENAALKAENAKYAEMKVLFEAGGFEAVIAAKKEEIRVLETRLYRESADKAKWCQSSKFWKGEALKRGYSSDLIIPLNGSPPVNAEPPVPDEGEIDDDFIPVPGLAARQRRV
jgi:ParB-like chromosome segregation protein Spo0J